MSGTGASVRSLIVWNITKTLMFLIVYWIVFLFGIPIGISIVEIQLGIQRFPPFPRVAGTLLIAATLLVVWSALLLAVRGAGTPLALDPTRQLVVSGPYRYVRHPFVVGAIGQIVALGLVLGSIPVLVYAAVALAVWYYVVRPGEERLLEDRFGARAQEYRQRVRGFRPF
jgi:protein-S-isoprenylcysteine O-methyltransferase Ste14